MKDNNMPYDLINQPPPRQTHQRQAPAPPSSWAPPSQHSQQYQPNMNIYQGPQVTQARPLMTNQAIGRYPNNNNNEQLHNNVTSSVYQPNLSLITHNNINQQGPPASLVDNSTVVGWSPSSNHRDGIPISTIGDHRNHSSAPHLVPAHLGSLASQHSPYQSSSSTNRVDSLLYTSPAVPVAPLVAPRSPITSRGVAPPSYSIQQYNNGALPQPPPPLISQAPGHHPPMSSTGINFNLNHSPIQPRRQPPMLHSYIPRQPLSQIMLPQQQQQPPANVVQRQTRQLPVITKDGVSRSHNSTGQQFRRQLPIITKEGVRSQRLGGGRQQQQQQHRQLPIITREGVLRLRDERVAQAAAGRGAPAAPTRPTVVVATGRQQVRPPPLLSSSSSSSAKAIAAARAMAGAHITRPGRGHSSSFSGHDGSLSGDSEYLDRAKRRPHDDERQQTSVTDEESESRLSDDEDEDESIQDENDGGPLQMALDSRRRRRRQSERNYDPSETSTNELRDDDDDGDATEFDDEKVVEMREDKMREADDEDDEDDDEMDEYFIDKHESQKAPSKAATIARRAYRRGSSSSSHVIDHRDSGQFDGAMTNSFDEQQQQPMQDEYYLDEEDELDGGGHLSEADLDQTAPMMDQEDEGEFYSALATVPEEEGKLSDRETFEDTSQFIDRGPAATATQARLHSREGQLPVGFDNNSESGPQEFTSINNDNQQMAGQRKQLPTIVENGFEAQVLEYLAGKKGMRRNELFSVDEEPSSYQDDAGSQAASSDAGLQMQQDQQEDLRQQQDITRAPHEQVIVVVEDDKQSDVGHLGPQIEPRYLPPQPPVSSSNGAVQDDHLFHDGPTPSPEVVNDDDDDDGDEQEILEMSPGQANKTSLEQEEYDEQYRDINNLDDLDRRATNHVHAIDGHSKSMLNDIHQQRTIVDYYDESCDPMSAGRRDKSPQTTMHTQDASLLPPVELAEQHLDEFGQPVPAIDMLHQDLGGGGVDAGYDPSEGQNFNSRHHHQLANEYEEGGPYGEDDAEVQAMMMKSDDHEHELEEEDAAASGLMIDPHLQQQQMMNELHGDRQEFPEDQQQQQLHYDDHRQEEDGARQEDEDDEFSQSGLPRARIRWITAVNKIVNRSSEVSRQTFSHSTSSCARAEIEC